MVLVSLAGKIVVGACFDYCAPYNETAGACLDVLGYAACHIFIQGRRSFEWCPWAARGLAFSQGGVLGPD